MRVSIIWFTKEGSGPQEFAFELKAHDAELDGRSPPSIGLHPCTPDQSEPPFVVEVVGQVGGGFRLVRKEVELLHGEIGGWLAETAPTPGAP